MTTFQKILSYGSFLVLLIGFRACMGDFSSKKKESSNTTTTESTSTNTQSTESSTPVKNTCSICGREFSGRGYEEVSDGIWKPCNEPYQCFICSPSCGRQSTRNMEQVLEKHGINPNIIHDNQPTNSNGSNSYYQGNDGRIHENNACSLCKGTGIETGWDPVTHEKTGRVCPMCNGNGHASY